LFRFFLRQKDNFEANILKIFHSEEIQNCLLSKFIGCPCVRMTQVKVMLQLFCLWKQSLCYWAIVWILPASEWQFTVNDMKLLGLSTKNFFKEQLLDSSCVRMTKLRLMLFSYFV
jgi:hypothetical protein